LEKTQGFNGTNVEITPGFCNFNRKRLSFLAGQVCVCHTRAIDHESVKDKLLEKLSTELALIPFATDPHAPPRGGAHNAMGPVVSKQQYDKVMGYIEGAKADPGCTLITGGGRPEALEGEKGYFVQPTIFEVSDNDAKIWKEEIFGPVLSVRTFKTEEEAVQMANDTTYGLADGVFSQVSSFIIKQYQ
jgi:acyl-CoA reductase-like NAD-dependent aldehyde dehydrogenase